MSFSLCVSNRYDCISINESTPPRANLAQKLGKFNDEIIPVGIVKEDDGIRPNTSVESLSGLKPVFDPDQGLTTAGNSSQLTDGAAAVLLMSRVEAQRRNLPILGVFKGLYKYNANKVSLTTFC